MTKLKSWAYQDLFSGGPTKNQRKGVSMLEQKRIIVTGAGSGIGRATSLQAAKYGARVSCVDIADSVSETAESIRENGGDAIAIQTDISS